MQYFVSISAYTGTVAGKQSKKKDNDQELTKYFINNCGSFWIMRVCLLFYGLKFHCPFRRVYPWPPINGDRVACASEETVQVLGSQNS